MGEMFELNKKITYVGQIQNLTSHLPTIPCPKLATIYNIYTLINQENKSTHNIT